MKVARLAGNLIKSEALTREEYPFETVFTCINKKCQCKYQANIGSVKKPYFSKWKEEKVQLHGVQ